MTKKNKPLTLKSFYNSIFTSNEFRTKRERERERNGEQEPNAATRRPQTELHSNDHRPSSTPTTTDRAENRRQQTAPLQTKLRSTHGDTPIHPLCSIHPPIYPKSTLKPIITHHPTHPQTHKQPLLSPIQSEPYMCVYIYIDIYLFIYLFVYLFVYLYNYVFIYLFTFF